MLNINSFDLFPFLLRAEDTTGLFAARRISKGTCFYNEGDDCDTVALVLNGSIRVSKIAKNGREVNLYRVQQGETCILTISSILSHSPYPATATVEQDSEVILLPVSKFQELMGTNPDFQTYIYRILSERLLEVLTFVEEVMFRKIDERVIEFLLNKLGQDGDTLTITHDELAVELGTAREVVSRIMKVLEREGSIALTRGKITLASRKQLEEKIHSM